MNNHTVLVRPSGGYVRSGGRLPRVPGRSGPHLATRMAPGGRLPIKP
jgi:hypothetical protein